MKKRELICISCPIGCRLQVEYEEGLIHSTVINPHSLQTIEQRIQVKGNRCSRGEIYGIEEILSPRRMVTATALIHSKLQARISLKTTAPIPKEHIFPLLKQIYKLKLKPPIKIGELIIKNYKNTGVDVVSTMEINE